MLCEDENLSFPVDQSLPICLVNKILTLLLALDCSAAFAQSPEEIEFARDYLNRLQERSFRSGREYCGFFGYDADGSLVAIKPRSGASASCTAYWPRAAIDVFASYHTHGSWDKYSDGEVPSVEDITSDMEDEIDGYLSTPGGRFWFIDGKKGIARQICGPGCLASDPNFRQEPAGSIPEKLTLEELEIRQGG